MNMKWILIFASMLFTLLAGNTQADEVDTSSYDGKFVLQVDNPSDSKYQDIYDFLKKDDTFQTTVDGFNKILKIPQNVDIIFEDNKDGPYYRPSEKKIHMSYDFFALIEHLFQINYPNEDKDDALDYAVDVNRLILFHELTHALIDIYQLPMIGDEETTADNLGAIIALEYTDNGLDIIFDGADFFDLLDKTRGDEQGESAYWDEHRMDSQRYYYILCLAYGKYPEAVTKELKSYNDPDLNEFLAKRKDWCANEYQKSLAKWQKILDPYLKEGFTPKPDNASTDNGDDQSSDSDSNNDTDSSDASSD